MELIRCIVGGFLMGVANLVPGISGGTMLLAVGVYPRFIKSLAEVTSFRFSKNNIKFLSIVIISAMLSIVFLAGILKGLVIDHRWVMYSLFIGLTLGGLPILHKLISQWSRSEYCALTIGFVLMFLLCMFQLFFQVQGQSDEAGRVLLFLAGAMGASAMVLPGISGGFILLLLNCYLPILSGIERMKDSLKSRDLEALFSVMIDVILPVGVGVVIGVIVVSQIVKWALEKHEKQTYALLCGVLLAATIGLWPFQKAVNINDVESVKGQLVEVIDGVLKYGGSGKVVKGKDLPMKHSLPDVSQGILGLLLIAAGYGATRLLEKFEDSKASAIN